MSAWRVVTLKNGKWFQHDYANYHTAVHWYHTYTDRYGHADIYAVEANGQPSCW